MLHFPDEMALIFLQKEALRSESVQKIFKYNICKKEINNKQILTLCLIKTSQFKESPIVQLSLETS